MKRTLRVGAAFLVTVLAACQGAYLTEILEAKTAKSITSFSFTSPAAAGTVDEKAKTITVRLPHGADVTALVATFTTTGLGVKVGSAVQVSGRTANDFTDPVTFTVSGADGLTANYTVTVTTAPSDAKEITAFSFPSATAAGTIDGAEKTIVVTAPYGTSVSKLVASFATTGVLVKVGSIVQISGTTANNFAGPVIYTVTAADGSTVGYTVIVKVGPSSAKSITSFSFASPAAAGRIDESAKTISVTALYGTNVTALVARFATTGSRVTVGSAVQVSGTTPNDFTSPVIYTVTAADESTASYTVAVAMTPPSSAKAITAFSFTSPAAAGTIREDLKTIGAAVPYGADLTVLVAKFTTTGSRVMVGSTVQVSGTTVNNFTNPFAYTVIAEDGSMASYSVTVTVAPWHAVGITDFSAGPASGYSLAIDPTGIPYVAFRDYDKNEKATVMKYTGGSWQTVGTAGFSAGRADHISLAIDSSGIAYVAYEDCGTDNKATVMMYAGGTWQALGGAGFSVCRADHVSLAIDSSNTPYVGFKNDYTGTPVVMKYIGGSWQVVGKAGFSLDIVESVRLVIDSTGVPYFAYYDNGSSGPVTVMKYAGGSWQVVGTKAFSTSETGEVSLAVDDAGTPYVAYTEDDNNYKATVMRYVGGSWQVVGAAAFSAGQAFHLSLKIDPAGVPYVAYEDRANGYRTTVMKYTGGSWQAVGDAGFSGTTGADVSLALDSMGTPYVACDGAWRRATVMRFK